MKQTTCLLFLFMQKYRVFSCTSHIGEYFQGYKALHPSLGKEANCVPPRMNSCNEVMREWAFFLILNHKYQNDLSTMAGQ